jgi:hypothetical protein
MGSINVKSDIAKATKCIFGSIFKTRNLEECRETNSKEIVSSFEAYFTRILKKL